MSDDQQVCGNDIRLSWKDTFKVVWPYARDKFLEQVKSIWFIVAYLVLFQWLILKFPVVYAFMIGVGIVIVALGLSFFMEGLRLGLMPFGETIGAILPRKSKLPGILGFAFLLGIGATFAEPAISVLKAAGAGVQPQQAPLLYSLLNDFAGQLVGCVALGVGAAVTLGILRFFKGWSLKLIIIPSVLVLSLVTLWAQTNAILSPIIGLAWDCGAVTTGPVTVPLVLALGIGVCRVVSTGPDDSNAGFGIVTLASLFPIIAALALGIFHYAAGDYYGAPNYQGDALAAEAAAQDKGASDRSRNKEFTEGELARYRATGTLHSEYQVTFRGGNVSLENGRIVHDNATIVLEKLHGSENIAYDDRSWNPTLNLLRETGTSLIGALQAIVPLCLFLFLTLRFFLRERVPHADEISVGILFAIAGMCLFGLGITIGLTPLGEQLGFNIPASFAEITPWNAEGFTGPLFGSGFQGKLVAIIFAFFLGYGATLAEPALNALGATVEKITVGAFKKSLLMQSVAFGVALGIAGGVCKIAYNIPLTYMLLPPYIALIVLTLVSSEEFVNFGWDSAGVTTGPITVPLVLAMGLGIGGNVPGVIDGFGILALASVGPIITVLTMGLIVRETSGDTPRKERSVT